MKKIVIDTTTKRMLADVFTPVGIYLRLRDRFRDTILMESTDHSAAENSYSFICINAIGGIEIRNGKVLEYKLPGRKPERTEIGAREDIPHHCYEFMQNFETISNGDPNTRFAQGLYGYSCYDAVQLFENNAGLKLVPSPGSLELPLMRYRLYQYVIAINHFKDELFICENNIGGIESEAGVVEALIRSKDVPVYPFHVNEEEIPGMTDEDYIAMVKKGIASCLRGDVFQIVLSRRYEQAFTGDEFNVYRALRSVNPSPYLFYFDYGDYKLMGSSPEAQLVIANGKAVLHPIAGTFKRTGNDIEDRQSEKDLLADAKENAEHVMLVDLARNDLSTLCDDVHVSVYRQARSFSHVIHLVSEVSGMTRPGCNPFLMMAKTFPAGTLSGAPKIRAMELIAMYENVPRNFYGGAIGYIGFDGNYNQAIMIRTFLSKNNKLVYQAGAGVVAVSKPENELQEVNNKLGALKKAVQLATEIK